MNAMDRIHHVEHRRRSRGGARFEAAWGAARGGDASVSAPEPVVAVPVGAATDEFAD